MWLQELQNPDSIYIPNNISEYLDEGIEFSIWNNVNFTTVFSWNKYTYQKEDLHHCIASMEKNNLSMSLVDIV